MKTVLLLGGPADGQRVEVHGNMRSALDVASNTFYSVVPLCSHGEVQWFGVIDGADPLALLVAGYGTGGCQDTDARDAQRLKKLHSHLCGYIENGGGEAFSVMQDDATRDWTVRVGSAYPAFGRQQRCYYGDTMREALDKAFDGEGDKS